MADVSYLHRVRAALQERGLVIQTAAFLLAALVLAPVVNLLWTASGGSTAHWTHLLHYVLPHAARNTLALLAGVGIMVTLLGTGAAWLVTAYDFPGRRTLTWALLLPLAVPTYIVAFAYLDLLHPIGPVQTTIRTMLGYDSPRQFRLGDLRSIWGAIFVLGTVLYPYVYLSTRAMFMMQSASLLEAARTLGCSPRQAFLRVALPMARPAIAVGVSLALLETLNDIGASEFLGVQTLTVAVYTTWITRSDLAGAAQIALSMLIIVLGLILLERHSRKRQRYVTTQKMRPLPRRALRGPKAWMALAAGVLPVLLGFLAPAAYLVVETVKRYTQVGAVSHALVNSLYNTLLVATAATVLTVAAGLILAWAGRQLRDAAPANGGRVMGRMASLGYALPGTVLAIGLLGPFVWFDRALGSLFGLSGLLLTGSMAALVIAYTVRFLAISVGSLEAGLARISPSLEQASRLLGHSPAGTLRRVHLPLLRPAMAAAALLVFVDAMKELPATLLLRPMNFDTLATWLYAEAARGTYEEGAIAALAIVLAGLLPVILLARTNLKFGN